LIGGVGSHAYTRGTKVEKVEKVEQVKKVEVEK